MRHIPAPTTFMIRKTGRSGPKKWPIIVRRKALKQRAGALGMGGTSIIKARKLVRASSKQLQ